MRTVRAKGKIRALGIELGGGKSERTALVLLEYYQREKKVFLHEHQAKIGAGAHRYGDEVLLEEIKKLNADRTGVNAPLSLPPCVQCSVKGCSGFRDCKNPPVRWMHEEAVRAKIPVSKHPTPYTQRPLDVYLRTEVQPRYNFDLFLEETLGAGRAPLALRMQYLLSRLGRKNFLETDPRVALAGIAPWFGMANRELRRYRLPEEGVEYRLGTAGGGNQALQPYLKKFPHRVSGALAHANYVHHNALYIGNHSELNEEQIVNLCKKLNNV